MKGSTAAKTCSSASVPERRKTAAAKDDRSVKSRTIVMRGAAAASLEVAPCSLQLGAGTVNQGHQFAIQEPPAQAAERVGYVALGQSKSLKA